MPIPYRRNILSIQIILMSAYKLPHRAPSPPLPTGGTHGGYCSPTNPDTIALNRTDKLPARRLSRAGVQPTCRIPEFGMGPLLDRAARCCTA